MKSIWFESNKTIDYTFVQLFSDCGIVNNHTFLCDVTEKTDKENLLSTIKSSDQICFNCSFVDGKDSTKLIDLMIYELTESGIHNKTIISGGNMLNALNTRYILPLASEYTIFFINNSVLELVNGKTKRIMFDVDLNKFKYI